MLLLRVRTSPSAAGGGGEALPITLSAIKAAVDPLRFHSNVRTPAREGEAGGTSHDPPLLTQQHLR